MSHFDSKVSRLHLLHKCCGFCAQKCSCKGDDCGNIWSPSTDNKLGPQFNTSPDNKFSRAVTQHQKKALAKELHQFRKELLEKADMDKMVTCPNLLMEFNSFHINQVLEHCDVLFSISDILKSVEIWRLQYAKGILQALSSVFNDIQLNSLEDDEGPISLEMSNYSEWSQIRDDSTLAELFNSHDLEELSSFHICMDTIGSSFEESF